MRISKNERNAAVGNSNKGLRPFFILVCSSTELTNTQGVSAAGANPEAQRLTPSIDAEFLALGKTLSAETLPVSPEGIISPAIISKACLNLLDAEIRIVNAGCFEPIKGIDPKNYFNFEIEPSKDFTKEDSFSFDECEAIFLGSIKLLDKLGFDENLHELIIAECVVGGTTTAVAVLELLGFDALDLISSSFKNNNKDIKAKLLKQLDARIKNLDLNELENPIYNCAIAGDKAQVVITGLVMSAMQEGIKTTLAGGTQMLAIYALIQELTEGFFMEDLIEIITSPWLINDESSSAQELAQEINEGLELGYCEDLSSIESILSIEIEKFTGYPNWPEIKRLYDQGHVKEGVGMGACLHLLHDLAA
jgi:uncharacterized protein (TIGR00303 family)